MNPNFDQMTRSELRQYLVAHRNDESAWEAYFKKPARRSKPYPAPLDEKGIRVMEEAFRQKFGERFERGSQIEGGDDLPA
ncbi:MAG: hypothetical protein JO235_01915 [Chroococcidiopsidaceae cyanobacterium CP_BM_RX_35]|nr:hypothetical protein [Chroococcidiopsidaceae cyanobacterium CP_BM_RX_35]